MKPNSNTNITNYTVDPVTQQITSLEVNGEAVEISGADLDDNKAVTINVSTYSGTVEVNPTSGKDGMKKVSIDLTNIPVPTGWTYVYHNGNSNGSDHEMYIIYLKIHKKVIYGNLAKMELFIFEFLITILNM